MFGTLKYDVSNADLKVVRLAYDPVSAHSRKHKACNRCHGMKVQCNGDRNGCDRCRAKKWTCTYSQSEYRLIRKNKNGGGSRTRQQQPSLASSGTLSPATKLTPPSTTDSPDYLQPSESSLCEQSAMPTEMWLGQYFIPYSPPSSVSTASFDDDCTTNFQPVDSTEWNPQMECYTNDASFGMQTPMAADKFFSPTCSWGNLLEDGAVQDFSIDPSLDATADFQPIQQATNIQADFYLHPDNLTTGST